MLKEMPKNEGGTPEKKQYKNSTGTKTEPVEKQPATYAELNIDKKDASKWQNMAENKKEIIEKIEECRDCMCDYVDGRLDCEIDDCNLYHWMPYGKLRKKKNELSEIPC